MQENEKLKRIEEKLTAERDAFLKAKEKGKPKEIHHTPQIERRRKPHAVA